MTGREARKFLKLLASPDENKSNAASDALRSFVLEAVDREEWGGRRLGVLDAIEKELTKLLSDLDTLEARRETNFATRCHLHSESHG